LTSCAIAGRTQASAPATTNRPASAVYLCPAFSVVLGLRDIISQCPFSESSRDLPASPITITDPTMALERSTLWLRALGLPLVRVTVPSNTGADKPLSRASHSPHRSERHVEGASILPFWKLQLGSVRRLRRTQPLRRMSTSNGIFASCVGTLICLSQSLLPRV
jgi:hypothetical protein